MILLNYLKKQLPSLCNIIEEQNFQEMKSSLQIRVNKQDTQTFIIQTSATKTFNQEYYDRAEFLSDFQAKKSTSYFARSVFYGEEMIGNTHLYLNDEDNESAVFVVFEDNLVIEKLGKTTKNSWFRK